VLKVLSDILQAVDQGDVTALVLLDLSAAFDTVDHDILLLRHQRRCPCMAPVLPVMPVSVCALRIKPFVNYLFGVWRSAGIGAGTTSVCSLHRWPHLTDRISLSVATPLRRRHAGFCRPSAVGELSASISECTAESPAG